MNILEYKAKEVFAKYNIPVPKGVFLSDPKESMQINFPVAVKAQVPVGGRGKAGGIKFANNLKELEKNINEMLGMNIRGFTVSKILIEEKLEIKKELYLGIALDRSEKAPLVIGSECGGVDIEEVGESKIIRKTINQFIGVRDFVIRELAEKFNIPDMLKKDFSNIVKNLYALFRNEDAELAEINPLVITKDNRIIAGDAKLVIDNDSLYRHKEYKGMPSCASELETKAAERDIALVQLDGTIGVIANGAGLTMATMDMISLYGGKPGVFLDLGGGADPERVKYALQLIKNANPNAVFINIFGGITRCDDVATGLKEMITKEQWNIPIVARIKGTNEKEAVKILKNISGIVPVESFEHGAKEVVRLCQ